MLAVQRGQELICDRLDEGREVDAFIAGAAIEEPQRPALEEILRLGFFGRFSARGVLCGLAHLDSSAWEAPFPSVVAISPAAQEQRAAIGRPEHDASCGGRGIRRNVFFADALRNPERRMAMS